MPRSTAEIHQGLRVRLDSIITDAMRADPDAAAGLTADQRQGIDRHSLDFLRGSRRTVLAAAVALSAVVDTHRRVPKADGGDVCRNCGTKEICPTVQRIVDTLAVYLPGPVALGRSDAWRRADAQLNADRHDQLVGLADITEGYVAWAVPGRYPGRERPADGETVLIIDKRSGRLTRWPALPLTVLSDQYHRYVVRHGVA